LAGSGIWCLVADPGDIPRLQERSVGMETRQQRTTAGPIQFRDPVCRHDHLLGRRDFHRDKYLTV